MIKKIMAITLVIILSVGTIYDTGNVSAQDIINENTEEISESFVDNMEDYEYIEQKVEDELNEYTELLDTEIEEALNKQGVFDSEIEQYPDDYLDSLNEVEPEDIEVQAQYYEVEDTEELEDIPITNEELKLVPDKDVNEYLAEEFYGEEIDDKEADNSLLVDQFLQAIGMKTIEVKAETQSKGGQSDKKNKTMLKKTITCIRKTKAYIYVNAVFQWTKMPEYRNMDTISLSWDKAKYDFEKEKETSVYHFWNQRIYDYYIGKNRIENEYTLTGGANMKYYGNPGKLKNNQYHVRGTYICCVAKLHEDTAVSKSESKYIKHRDYFNEGVSITLYLRKKQKKKKKKVIFYPYYQHTQTKSDLLSVLVAMADKGVFSATYALAKGKTYVTTNFSGVDDPFKFKM